MKYEVRLADNETHVVIRPGETTTWDGIMESLSKAAKIANTNDLQNYLIDVRGVASGFSPDPNTTK